MKIKAKTTIATYCVLALAGVISFSLPHKLAPVKAAPTAAAPPALNLVGVVRDFRADHPDFDQFGSFGHYAGNVAADLGVDVRPVYTGSGFRVTTQWTDANGRPIAPHLFGVFNYTGPCYIVPGIATDGQIEINNQSSIDSFNSNLGTYGGANVGADALISTNATSAGSFENLNNSDISGAVYVGPGGNTSTTYVQGSGSTLSGSVDALTNPVPMPSVTMPTGLGPSTGDRTFGTGSHVISSNLHVNRLLIRRDATVTIDGNITILCESDFILAGVSAPDFSKLYINPGSSLSLYVRGDMTLNGEMNMNTGDPSVCRIYKPNSGTIRLRLNSADICAKIVAPNSLLQIEQGAELYGTFIGRSLDMDNFAGFHVDVGSIDPYAAPPDIAGAFGSSGGGVQDADSFAQWFRDYPGISSSAAYILNLPRGVDGFYMFATDDFHPIDGRLFGNEGEEHNRFFTYVIDAQFEHIPCIGQIVEFQGDDDAWIFVNGKLVMDLGGLVPGTPQVIEMDRLGLTAGQTHSLMFFYAQRQRSLARFRLRTNIPLFTVNITPSVSSSFD